MVVLRKVALTALVLAAEFLKACSPTLDWREVRPPESQLQLVFPCKPVAQHRSVQLAGQPMRLALHACSTGGQMWALAFADLADPLRVTAALAELSASAAANIVADATRRSAPLQVPGATPNPASQRQWLAGKLPDGTAKVMQVAVFTYGTRVFQATVLGDGVPDEAVEVFFGAIRVRP